jgi:hypothetical protein
LDSLRAAGLTPLDHDIEFNPPESGVEGGHLIVLVRGGRADFNWHARTGRDYEMNDSGDRDD